MAKAEVRRYRLKKDAGPHYEPNPDFDVSEPESEENFRDKEYAPGDIVKSKRALDKLFVNKFEPLDTLDRGKMGAAGGEEVDPDNDPERDRPARDYEVARVNATDRHLTEDELEEHPAQKLAKGRSPQEIKKAKAAPNKNDLVTEEDADLDEAAEETEESGSTEEEQEDVTSGFKKAKEGGLKVFKVGDKYHVHEEGEDEPMSGAKKGFTTKTDVQKFINKNVKTEEAEEE